VTVQLYLVRSDPVQEVAAETATLEALKSVLRAKTATPKGGAPGPASLVSGWPLVVDDTLPPGIVSCRPTPGAPRPPTPSELRAYTAYMRELTR
jgi:hypothetical protein